MNSSQILTVHNPLLQPYPRDCWGSRHCSKNSLIMAIISGLVTIFSSTGYMSQFDHGTVVLPWQFPGWVLIPFILTGVFLFLGVALNPKVFWPVLVGTSVFTAGMFVLRFPIFDEWLVGSILLGGMVSVAIGSVPLRKKLGPHKTWALLFLTLGLYLSLLSVLGFVTWGNPKALRFSMTFIVIFLIGVLLIKYDFPLLGARSVTLLVAKTSLAYYFLYIIHALVFLESIYINIMEGIGGAGSGYHNVVGVVAAPAAFILIGREQGRRRMLGWIVLVMVLTVAALSDSRGGMMTVLGAACVAPFAIGIKRSFRIIFMGIVVSILIGSIAFQRPQWVLDIGESMVKALVIESGTSTYDYFGREVTVAKGDAGRFLYVRAAVETLMNENPVRAIMGAGIYGYFPVAGPYYEQVAEDYGVPTTNVNFGSSIGGISEPPRPPAMGAMIVETGLLGIALLALCALAAFSSTILRLSRTNQIRLLKGPNLLVGSSIILALVWAYLGEAQDIVLFYLLIMPFGLIHTWSQKEKGSTDLVRTHSSV